MLSSISRYPIYVLPLSKLMENTDYLPLREPTFFILLSLSDGSKHGYAILKDVEALSNGRVALSTSTLYEALARLLDQGLVARVSAAERDDAADSHPGRPRKLYRLTLTGQRVLSAELARLEGLVALARRRLEALAGR
jgi:DNA-binding PadR family transcriptional regulator